MIVGAGDHIPHCPSIAERLFTVCLKGAEAVGLSCLHDSEAFVVQCRQCRIVENKQGFGSFKRSRCLAKGCSSKNVQKQTYIFGSHPPLSTLTTSHHRRLQWFQSRWRNPQVWCYKYRVYIYVYPYIHIYMYTPYIYMYTYIIYIYNIFGFVASILKPLQRSIALGISSRSCGSSIGNAMLSCTSSHVLLRGNMGVSTIAFD